MKRISDKVIGLLEWESATLDMSFMDDYKNEVNVLLDAQLEADKKDHALAMETQAGYLYLSNRAEIRKIFKEIEERLFAFDGDGNLILTSSPPGNKIVAWWQALKERYTK